MTARKKAVKKKTAPRRSPAPHAVQEGSVESLGGGPSGTDREDRSGEGTARSGPRATRDRGRDSFVSSEVGGKTSTPGKDPRTRS